MSQLSFTGKSSSKGRSRLTQEVRPTASQIIADEEASDLDEYEEDLEGSGNEDDFGPSMSRSSRGRKRRKGDPLELQSQFEERNETDAINFQLLVRNVVRYAICSQTSHNTITRKDIVQKAFPEGTSRNLFQSVFEEADRQLQLSFGFRLVAVTQSNRKKDMAVSQLRRPATSNANSSNLHRYWVLRSTLPMELQKDSRLIVDSVLDTAYYGFLMTVIAFIAVSHCSVGHSELQSFLQELLTEEETTPLHLDITRSLSLLVRQGYLDRVKDDTHNQFVYYIGSRAVTEISIEGLKSFVTEFFPDSDIDMDALLTEYRQEYQNQSSSSAA
ncbi:Smc5-6 complex non-SMC subunit Nse3 [Schizosaccharomyces pombe]|uniref:Non-structural maintenance of chromosome element 3 n=1 Tax=Schizosaccharomyces pombe (strain 972 / ATCC 24843) TaxID=284812 RepID=NSE3_SCHPO|nr:Smc5-6 complex non-SMC subunit Nse3 [Schizosaccharomyces pombe]Q9Y7U4.1 RecName: Full=Non-structural maintenance of chromosome element 3; Short=Non-SMC element 3 [Schizosaccharomyces pombe 972h-]CAB39900.1 Smc5-6 complex non-SMC subunit Nse3 [Schizosaccharomyces pombe]|eukprot:NP_588113.1 Smc5-6 complex non-SMC subunit Nse3 [Schizosaccharomyces pombe]